ncbi:MAG: hypothetical protein D6717_07290 [Gammaproteobacteria bacterium]|nr:MAG: hypothetical protein D6717_07290 [Gammaproteobacteria bacterium]
MPLEDSRYLFFRAARTGAPSLEAAEHDAFQAAVRQIIELLGQEGVVYYASERDALVTRITDRLTLSARGQVRGARLVELYYVVRPLASGDRVYDAWVLARWPREELARERERYRRWLEDLYQRWIACARREQARPDADPRRELARLGVCDALLKQLPDSYVSERGDGVELRSWLAAELRRQARGDRIYRLELTGDVGAGDRLPLSELDAELQRLDFSRNDSEPRYRLSLDLRAGEARSNLGLLTSVRVSLKLRLDDLVGDLPPVERQVVQAGFGTNAGRAREDAIRRAVRQLAASLAAVLGQSGAGLGTGRATRSQSD